MARMFGNGKRRGVNGKQGPSRRALRSMDPGKRATVEDLERLLALVVAALQIELAHTKRRPRAGFISVALKLCADNDIRLPLTDQRRQILEDMVDAGLTTLLEKIKDKETSASDWAAARELIKYFDASLFNAAKLLTPEEYKAALDLPFK